MPIRISATMPSNNNENIFGFLPEIFNIFNLLAVYLFKNSSLKIEEVSVNFETSPLQIKIKKSGDSNWHILPEDALKSSTQLISSPNSQTFSFFNLAMFNGFSTSKTNEEQDNEETDFISLLIKEWTNKYQTVMNYIKKPLGRWRFYKEIHSSKESLTVNLKNPAYLYTHFILTLLEYDSNFQIIRRSPERVQQLIDLQKASADLAKGNIDLLTFLKIITYIANDPTLNAFKIQLSDLKNKDKQDYQLQAVQISHKRSDLRNHLLRYQTLLRDNWWSALKNLKNTATINSDDISWLFALNIETIDDLKFLLGSLEEQKLQEFVKLFETLEQKIPNSTTLSDSQYLLRTGLLKFLEFVTKITPGSFEGQQQLITVIENIKIKMGIKVFLPSEIPTQPKIPEASNTTNVIPTQEIHQKNPLEKFERDLEELKKQFKDQLIPEAVENIINLEKGYSLQFPQHAQDFELITQRFSLEWVAQQNYLSPEQFTNLFFSLLEQYDFVKNFEFYKKLRQAFLQNHQALIFNKQQFDDCPTIETLKKLIACANSTTIDWVLNQKFSTNSHRQDFYQNALWPEIKVVLILFKDNASKPRPRKPINIILLQQLCQIEGKLEALNQVLKNPTWTEEELQETLDNLSLEIQKLDSKHSEIIKEVNKIRDFLLKNAQQLPKNQIYNYLLFETELEIEDDQLTTYCIQYKILKNVIDNPSKNSKPNLELEEVDIFNEVEKSGLYHLVKAFKYLANPIDKQLFNYQAKFFHKFVYALFHNSGQLDQNTLILFLSIIKKEDLKKIRAEPYSKAEKPAPYTISLSWIINFSKIFSFLEYRIEKNISDEPFEVQMRTAYLLFESMNQYFNHLEKILPQLKSTTHYQEAKEKAFLLNGNAFEKISEKMGRKESDPLIKNFQVVNNFLKDIQLLWDSSNQSKKDPGTIEAELVKIFLKNTIETCFVQIEKIFPAPKKTSEYNKQKAIALNLESGFNSNEVEKDILSHIQSDNSMHQQVLNYFTLIKNLHGLNSQNPQNMCDFLEIKNKSLVLMEKYANPFSISNNKKSSENSGLLTKDSTNSNQLSFKIGFHSQKSTGYGSISKVPLRSTKEKIKSVLHLK